MFSFDRTRSVLFSCGFALLCLSCGLCSCTNTRSLVYLQGSFDTAKLSEVITKEAIIQKGDLLSIIVYSDNPEATKIYNQTLITTAAPPAVGSASSTSTGGVTGSSPSTGGYLVDENGNIEFQGLGLLHVDGLNRAQLKDTLNGRLKDYLVNPYFTIRYLNNKFTILGEIARPGTYGIPGDRMSLLEALGISGDLTFYGRRDNILVIRETNGKREFGRLDITKPEIINSPYFYIQSSDVVIVEPNKKKVAANDASTVRTITIAATVISTFALLYSIFHK